MADSTPLILVLGATGKTGSRVANNLTTRGLAVRTAARSGADIRFDWDAPGTYAPALEGVDRVYLLGPVMRTDFAGQVTKFLDQAEVAGVRHITYLSAYGIDAAPPEMAMRSVELDLLGRQGFTHSILRPAWFMQNFSETFLRPVDGAIVVPTGDVAEAFIDAEDIAAVAAATLADPDAMPVPSTRSPVPRHSPSPTRPRLSAGSPARPSRTLTLTATPGSPARSPAGYQPNTGRFSGC